MFNRISNDLVRQIFEFDNTFKQEFDNVLDGLLTSKMKVLQKFLGTYNGPDVAFLGKGWQAMKRISFRGDDHYTEITSLNIFRTTFYVVSEEERDVVYNDPVDRMTPNVIRSNLYRLSPETIAYYIGCSTETVENIQKDFDDKETCNEVLYDLLGNDYAEYAEDLKMHGVYDAEIHKYLFEDMRYSRNDYYLEMDAFNYHVFENEQDGKKYYIYWSMSTAVLQNHSTPTNDILLEME